MNAYANHIKPPNIGWNMLKHEARSGLKAGMVTGAVFGLVTLPLNYFVLLHYSSEISRVLPGYTPSLEGILQLGLNNFFVFSVAGLSYGLAYDRLPTKSAFGKAVFIGVIIFLVSTSLNYVTDYHVSPGLFFANEILNIGVLLVALPYSLARLYTSFR
jgi:thiamine transporter ThiT